MRKVGKEWVIKDGKKENRFVREEKQLDGRMVSSISRRSLRIEEENKC